MNRLMIRFLLLFCISSSSIFPMQAANKQGFFASLIDISSRYFSELSSLSQVSLSHQFARLREKEIVLASDQKKNVSVYKKMVCELQKHSAFLKKEAMHARAYLKTDAGKKKAYESALFAILMIGGYSIWLQNQQMREQLVAVQASLAQLAADSERKDAAALARDRLMRQENAALHAAVAAIGDEVHSNNRAIASLRRRLFKSSRKTGTNARSTHASTTDAGDSGAETLFSLIKRRLEHYF